MDLGDLTERIGGAGALDAVGEPAHRRLRALRRGAAHDVLGGRWLGHPLHPAVVQLPVGAWLSAGILDAGRRTRPGATLLTAVGLAGALPAVVTGMHDWAGMARPQRRIGVVHAAANTIGFACQAASLMARLRGRSDAGRRLSWVGLAAAGLGAYLGGHLAYHPATDRPAPDPARAQARTLAGSGVVDI